MGSKIAIIGLGDTRKRDMGGVSKALNKVVGNYEFLRQIDLYEGILEFRRPARRKSGDRERSKNDNPNIRFVIEEPLAVSLGSEHPPKRWEGMEKEDEIERFNRVKDMLIRYSSKIR